MTVYVIPAGSNPEDYMEQAIEAGCDGGILVASPESDLPTGPWTPPAEDSTDG